MKLYLWLIMFCVSLFLVAGCGKKDDAVHPKTPGVDLAQGKKVYNERCAACHDRGLAGAPQTGKKEEWTSALAQGIEVMVAHSINGYRGERGLMPARGGHADLSDSDVTSAVHYIVEKSR